MQIHHADTPDLTDAIVREKTAKTPKQWFADLDAFGGLDQGRRALITHLHGDLGLDDWWATTLVVEYERQRGQQEKDGLPKGYSICATKTITAPLAEVFRAFSEAKTLDRWLGPKTRIDFRDGGTLDNADGDKATFRRIRVDKDLRLTWEHARLAPGSTVDVLFADKGKGKTGITLNHARIQSRRDADALRAGWGAAFDRLKASLEKS